MISDMLYGGLDQYEGCHELTEKPKTFCYESGLLEDFGNNGYQTGVFVHPFFELSQVQGQLFLEETWSKKLIHRTVNFYMHLNRL